jgi:predicted transcriptional regulator
LIIILITIIEDNKMVTKKTKTDSILHIIIGGNFSKDFDDLLNGKIDLKTSPKNAIYLDNFAQLNKLLSPSKLDLLKYLVEVQNLNDPKSLSVIAYNLKRKKEAISRDIKQLNNLGLIVLKKVKQTIYAIPKYNSIEIKTI